MLQIDHSVRQLPAAAVAEALNRCLETCGTVVVTAPPGAGKSTVLPLTILEAMMPGLEAQSKIARQPKPGLRSMEPGPQAGGGKIVMLEPRRIAARQIAGRMAELLGEEVGETVGYRIRFEKKVSRRTRIEVVTEGILTRMLVEDPTLEGVSVLIFDEFHERSLQTDLALSLAREAQDVLRPDLKLVLMSATIDVQALCAVLDAQSVSCEGKMFPVEIRYMGDTPVEDIVEATIRMIRSAHKEQEGDILAFLPGEGEIRRCAEALGSSLGQTHLCPLYGMLSIEEQRRAIAPSRPGQRKVVLATPIAETSLTIEGVRVVVDAGYCRKPVFDARTALEHLETVRISRDMAAQRSGRAGRVAPGVCYRLWSKAAETRMAELRKPEIVEADLAPMVLQVAAWGEAHPERLPWLTPPPVASLKAAQTLLVDLGAIDEESRITPHGRAMASLPCHPRVAQLLLKAEDDAQKALAADIAALLEEKDPMSAEADPDMALRIDALRRARASGRLGSWGRVARIAAQYRDMVGVVEDNGRADAYVIGQLTASAYPERVARVWKEGHGQYCLSSGDIVALDEGSALSGAEWLAVASVHTRSGGSGRIFLAAPVAPPDLRPLARPRDAIFWDTRSGGVAARRTWRIGVHVLEEKPLQDVDRESVVKVICEAARKEGRSLFAFSDEVENLQRRIATVAAWHPELALPDVSTEALLERAREWLPDYIGKATTAAQLGKIEMEAVIWSLLSYEQHQAVDRIAPSHVLVPTGSRIRLAYRQGAEAPVLRVRLQECFGLLDTPRVDGGRRPILMELLSPGYKAVQLTSDLRSFWENAYFEVRKELRRRYPKHAWPDDPLAADPVRGVRKKTPHA
ncbi:MAG: ATP-dependent helicase HrpB [Bacteroidales bacterium]|nr:ATP-dependent helicase HrpB [Bacteroidales bacterium]